MYGNPATPFVAEFIGTMNRLIATVGDDGAIDYDGLLLRVDAARGLPRGERVLCLVRPETVKIVRRERRAAGELPRRRGDLPHLPRRDDASPGRWTTPASER